MTEVDVMYEPKNVPSETRWQEIGPEKAVGDLIDFGPYWRYRIVGKTQVGAEEFIYDLVLYAPREAIGPSLMRRWWSQWRLLERIRRHRKTPLT